MEINKDLPVYSARSFTWWGKLGVTEMSDLSRFPDYLGNQVYTSGDTGARGFKVKGKHSTQLFILVGRDHNREGEITQLRYETIGQEFKITIFND